MTYNYYFLTGCSILQRDILEQTTIECLIRSKQFHEARQLLSERVVSAPNDAQSWRRLSMILRELNLKEAAESADYTAWQLGNIDMYNVICYFIIYIYNIYIYVIFLI